MNLDTSLLPSLSSEPPRPIFEEPMRSILKITSALQKKISIKEEENTTHSSLKTGRTYEMDKELRKSNYWGTAHIQKNTNLYGMNQRIEGLVSLLKEEEALDENTRLSPNYKIKEIEHESQWTPTLEKIQHDAGIASKHEIGVRLRTVEELHQKKHETSQIERANRIFTMNQKLSERTLLVPSIKSLLKTSPSVSNFTTLDDVIERKRKHIDDEDLSKTA